jgi:hypothetical protein
LGYSPERKAAVLKRMLPPNNTERVNDFETVGF